LRFHTRQQLTEQELFDRRIAFRLRGFANKEDPLK
jgi:hypothetical protein